MSSGKQLVVKGYDAIHDHYAEWAGYETSRRHHYLDLAWRLGLVRLGDALDLGCGTGRHATSLLADGGFRVTGLDASARSIEAARREVPAATFVVGDMATASFPARSFDLVTAFYSIIHVPRAEHGPLLRRVAAWMKPGGTLVASLGTTGLHDAAVRHHNGPDVEESLGEADSGVHKDHALRRPLDDGAPAGPR